MTARTASEYRGSRNPGLSGIVPEMEKDMAMSKLTDQLRTDEQLLRREIGKTLVVPLKDLSRRRCRWREGRRCYHGEPERLSDGRSTKMCQNPCDVFPAPFTGDLAIAAELLLRKCDKSKLFYAIERFLRATGHKIPEDTGGYWEWFVYANPADRCIVCLMALDPQPEEKP